MSRESDAYQAAYEAYANAKAAAEALVDQIVVAANRLSGGKWQRVKVLGAGAFPGLGWGVTLDATKFPTGQKLGEALAAYHKATLDLANTWIKVPPSGRAGLTPPPGDVNRSVALTTS